MSPIIYFLLFLALALPLFVVFFGLGWLWRGLRCGTEIDALRYRAHRAEDELAALGGGSVSSSGSNAGASGRSAASAGASKAPAAKSASKAATKSAASKATASSAAAAASATSAGSKPAAKSAAAKPSAAQASAAKEAASERSSKVKELTAARDAAQADLDKASAPGSATSDAKIKTLTADRDGYQTQLDFLDGIVAESADFLSGKREADDLMKIKGVGKVLNGKLNAYGLYSYEQLVHWDDAKRDVFASLIGFGDRVSRDDWRGQAATLHQEKYGKKA